MSAFHLFPRLPAEIRHAIWEYSIEHRTVDNRAFQSMGGALLPNDQGARDPYIPVLVPSLMQACQESRNQQLYDKVEYKHLPKYRRQSDACVGDATVLPDSSRLGQRYAWINFEMDMIDIGADHLATIKHIAPKIRRLKFERVNSCEYWYETEALELAHFCNVELFHVVDATSVDGWRGAWEEYTWPCIQENLVFINKNTGETVNAVQLQAREDAEIAKEWDEFELEDAYES